MAIRLIIADDHRLVREGLRSYLSGTDDIEVVGEASDGQELLTILEQAGDQLDLALVDARMPDVDGLEAARWIRDRHPRVAVVMLIPSGDGPLATAAVEAGARGYVFKSADSEDVIRTVRRAADSLRDDAAGTASRGDAGSTAGGPA
jgi:DNA-binding NarL/FixJ family response regulator